MANRFIQTETLTNIADAIRAKTGSAESMTPAQMADAIAAIPSGTEITDGIVVKARNANGYATEVDYYNSDGAVYPYQFAYGDSSMQAYRYLTLVNFKAPITTIGDWAFRGSQAQIDETNIQTVNFASFYYYNGKSSLNFASLEAIYARQTFGRIYSTELRFPKCTSYSGPGSNEDGIFSNATSLTLVQMGSVGCTVTNIKNNTFWHCTQTALTVEIYTTGEYAETLAANVRNCATNATIVIKASEATTYNGTSYAAGDTILTSEVESTS